MNNETEVGYRLEIRYERIYNSVESVISNTSNNIYGVALCENETKGEYIKYSPYIPYELGKIAGNFIRQIMKERNIDEDEIDIREVAQYCYSQKMAKLVRVIEYQSGENVVLEVNDAYRATFMIYADHKYDGYELELGYVFEDVKNYLEGNNIDVMPQKYVEWTSEDKRTMYDWEDICDAWIGFVKPISRDDVDYIIKNIVGDGMIHPCDDEIAKMRKAFLNSDNHYYDDY